MPRTLVGPIALVLLSFGCHATSDTDLPIAAESQMRAHVAELASDDYAGRFTFDDGGARTVEYLAEVYRRWGIAPLAEEYGVPFLVTGTQERRCDSLSFEVAERESSVARDDYTPFAFSGDGEAEGELVFVGYAGQSHPDAQYHRSYDAFAGVDLRGKIAVVLPGQPQDPWLRSARMRRIAVAFIAEVNEHAERGDIEGMRRTQARARAELVALVEADLVGATLAPEVREAILAVEFPTARRLDLVSVMELTYPALAAVGHELRPGEHTTYAKAERLQARGAAGVIFVNGPNSFVDEAEREADALPEIRIAPRQPPLDIPVVQVRSAAATELLARLDLDLGHEQAELDAWHGPRSVPLSGRASLHVSVGPLLQRTDNVLAMIPGSDLADELVILGAHWDHVGTADNGLCLPLERDDGELDTICNGADDNASGTAMVLAVAQAIADSSIQPRRTIVFAHFAGEELGLLGSAALVRDWPTELGKLHSMINLDMVGRLSNEGLVISGVGTSASWAELLAEIGYAGSPVCLDPPASAASDGYSFAQAGVPSVGFYTLAHGDYHMASDEYETINFEGMNAIAQTVLALTLNLADGVELEPALPSGGGYGTHCPVLYDHQAGVVRRDGRAPTPLLPPGFRTDLR